MKGVQNHSKSSQKKKKKQAPILRSIKSKWGANQISKEFALLNKVFLICYINTQSGPYGMRVANYFQMFRTKFTLQYPCNDMTPGITEMRENGFRQEQIRLKKTNKAKGNYKN